MDRAQEQDLEVELTSGRPTGNAHAVRAVSPHSLKEHPLASLVPNMRPQEFEDLLADIAAHGILTPLQVNGDVILDGRHRCRAAITLGLPQVPVTEQTLSPDESLEFMLKAALLRRHLNDDQRAMIAARYASRHPRPRGGDRRSQKAQGAFNLVPGDQIDSTPTRSTAAALMNVAAARVQKASSVLSTAPELAMRVHAGEIKLSQAVRTIRRAEQVRRIEQAHLPQGKFRTIVADPPWAYADSHCRGAAEDIYPTMRLEDICALPIAERAADESHLFLWVPTPHLELAFNVVRAWGFQAKTVLTWIKLGLGLGRYFRTSTEHIVFGTRGNLLLREQNLRNWFHAPNGAHSEKPASFYELVEKACFGPYLELFARRRRPGWTCWGAEVDAPIHQTGFDVKAEEPENTDEASR